MSIRRDYLTIYNEFMIGTENYFSSITAFKYLLPEYSFPVLDGFPVFQIL